MATQIIGVGSARPNNIISSELWLDRVRWWDPRKEVDVTAEKLKRLCGIESHCLAIDSETGHRLTPHEVGLVDADGFCVETRMRLRPDPSEDDPHILEIAGSVIRKADGGKGSVQFSVKKGQLTPKESAVTDTDLATLACMRAVHDAGLSVEDLNDPNQKLVIVWVTCTPATLHCGNDEGDLQQRLGCGPDVSVLKQDLGCAGPASLFGMAYQFLNNGFDRVIVVASNCTSGAAATPEYLERARLHPHEWASATSAFFADGAGAIVIEDDGSEESGGLLATGSFSFPLPLVTYPGCGSALPNSLRDQLYLMDAPAVSAVFMQMMRQSLRRIDAAWDDKIAPIVGGEYNLDRFRHVFVHQANRHLVELFARENNIPQERVPINVHKYSNLVSASTLLLFHEELKAGRITPNELMLFIVVGAGRGAMGGYAVIQAPGQEFIDRHREASPA